GAAVGVGGRGQALAARRRPERGHHLGRAAAVRDRDLAGGRGAVRPGGCRVRGPRRRGRRLARLLAPGPCRVLRARMRTPGPHGERRDAGGVRALCGALSAAAMSTARDAPWRGMAAIAVLAYAACDLLHEAAHVAAAWLPVGVRSVTISTVGVSSFGESAIVSLAGPLANLVLGSTLWLMRSHALPATARYATWLFGSINGFNATAYLLYSALLGGGDWATVW